MAKAHITLETAARMASLLRASVDAIDEGSPLWLIKSCHREVLCGIIPADECLPILQYLNGLEEDGQRAELRELWSNQLINFEIIAKDCEGRV